MEANAITTTFLATVACTVVLAHACAAAQFATISPATVLAHYLGQAQAAGVLHNIMRADAGGQTLTAIVFHVSVGTKLRTTAIAALGTLPPMLTDSLPTAFLANVLDSGVWTDGTSLAIDAHRFLPSVWAAASGSGDDPFVAWNLLAQPVCNFCRVQQLLHGRQTVWHVSRIVHGFRF